MGNYFLGKLDSSRSIRFYWIVLSLLYLAFRLQFIPSVVTQDGVVLPGTDPYYRAHRIQKIVSDHFIYPLHDEQLSFPNGLDVPWPTGLDYALALPLKLFGITNPDSITKFCAFAIPFLSLPALWLMGWIITKLLNSWLALAAGFMLTVAPPHIHISRIGRIDHHFLESIFLLCALALLLKIRSYSNPKTSVLLIILLSLAPLFWPQAWILGIFILGSFLMDRDSLDRQTGACIFLWSGLASICLLTLSHRFIDLYISPFAFSWWTPVVYLFISALLVVIHFWHEKHLSKKYLSISIFTIFAILGILFFSQGKIQVLGQSLVSSWHALLGSQGILSRTWEAQTPLTMTWTQWSTLGVLPLAFTWLWFPFSAFQKKQWWLVGFVILPIFMAFLQRRFMAFAWPIVILVSALFFFELLQLYFGHRKKRAIAITGLVLLLLSLPGIPWHRWKTYANTQPHYHAITDACRFLKTRMDANEDQNEVFAVATHWKYGHWVLYHLDVPVVASPFQDETALETLDLFTSKDLDELERFWKKHPVRYLIVDYPGPKFLVWLKMRGGNPKKYFKQIRKESADATKFVPEFLPKPKAYQLLMPRLFFEGNKSQLGVPLPHWKMIYKSPHASPHDPTQPALLIYERTGE